MKLRTSFTYGVHINLVVAVLKRTTRLMDKRELTNNTAVRNYWSISHICKISPFHDCNKYQKIKRCQALFLSVILHSVVLCIPQTTFFSGIRICLQKDSPNLVAFVWFNGVVIPYCASNFKLTTTWSYLDSDIHAVAGTPPLPAGMDIRKKFSNFFFFFRILLVDFQVSWVAYPLVNFL